MFITIYRQTDTARRIAREKGLEYLDERFTLKSNAKFLNKNCLPSLMDKTISGYVTHVRMMELFINLDLDLLSLMICSYLGRKL